MTKKDPSFPLGFHQFANGDESDCKTIAYKHFKKDQNSPLAFEWFYRSAANGDVAGQYALGCMYLNGFGTNKDFNKAAKWLVKSYKQNYKLSLLSIAKLFEEGFAFEKHTLPFKSAGECYDRLEKEGILKEKTIKPEEVKNTVAPTNFFPTKYDLVLSKTISKLSVNIRAPERPVSEAQGDKSNPIENLIGLEDVKQQIRAIKNRAIFIQKRKEAGLPITEQSQHFAFLGNPGTGKTEVARGLGQIYKDAGILKSGHVVEVGRSDLVGQYIGQTGKETKKFIDKAIDGVLFIDEAYSLVNLDSARDFGWEALSQIVKAMEDHRNCLIVVFAGYQEPLEFLIRSNAGLKSRIKNHVYFPDYNAEELVAIYYKYVHDNRYLIDENAVPLLEQLMKKAKKLDDSDFGNARFARNVFEKTIEKVATRVPGAGLSLDDPDNLQNIMFMDIPSMEEITGRKRKGKTSGDNIIPF